MLAQAAHVEKEPGIVDPLPSITQTVDTYVQSEANEVPTANKKRRAVCFADDDLNDQETDGNGANASQLDQPVQKKLRFDNEVQLDTTNLADNLAKDETRLETSQIPQVPTSNFTFTLLPTVTTEEPLKPMSPLLLNTAAEVATPLIHTYFASHGYTPRIVVGLLVPHAHVYVLSNPMEMEFIVSTICSFHTYTHIGIDCEFVHNIASTIQIAFAADLIVIFQMHHLITPETFSPPLPPSLKTLLENPSITKTGVSVATDSQKIESAFGTKSITLFDSSTHAKQLGFRAQSLRSLYFILVHAVEPAFKGVSSGQDWSLAVLPDGAVKYAANDAIASLLCYRAITATPVEVLAPVAPWDKYRPCFTEYVGSEGGGDNGIVCEVYPGAGHAWSVTNNNAFGNAGTDRNVVLRRGAKDIFLWMGGIPGPPPRVFATVGQVNAQPQKEWLNHDWVLRRLCECYNRVTVHSQINRKSSGGMPPQLFEEAFLRMILYKVRAAQAPLFYLMDCMMENWKDATRFVWPEEKKKMIPLIRQLFETTKKDMRLFLCAEMVTVWIVNEDITGVHFGDKTHIGEPNCVFSSGMQRVRARVLERINGKQSVEVARAAEKDIDVAVESSSQQSIQPENPSKLDDDENVVVACETRKSPPEQNESEAEVDMEISDSESDGIVALEEGKPPLIEEVAVAGPELGVVGEIVIGPNGETDFEMDCDSVAGSDYDVLEVEAGPSMCLFTELPVIENPTVNTTICNEETKVAICCSSEECESDVESYTFGWEVKKALE